MVMSGDYLGAGAAIPSLNCWNGGSRQLSLRLSRWYTSCSSRCRLRSQRIHHWIRAVADETPTEPTTSRDRAGSDGDLTMTRLRLFRNVTLACCAASIAALAMVHGQQPDVRFGGAYAGLDARRQHLVANWVARFARVTGKPVEPGPFYDDVLTVSTKTSFDAVTHALMTTPLMDKSGASLGDALALVDRVDTVRGEIEGAASDRQFRLYVRLVPGAAE